MIKNTTGSNNDKNKDAITYSPDELNTQYAGIELSNQQQECYRANNVPKSGAFYFVYCVNTTALHDMTTGPSRTAHDSRQLIMRISSCTN